LTIERDTGPGWTEDFVVPVYVAQVLDPDGVQRLDQPWRVVQIG
jgi:hypothetical protein